MYVLASAGPPTSWRLRNELLAVAPTDQEALDAAPFIASCLHDACARARCDKASTHAHSLPPPERASVAAKGGFLRPRGGLLSRSPGGYAVFGIFWYFFGAKFFPRIWQSSLGCSSVPRGGAGVVVFLLTGYFRRRWASRCPSSSLLYSGIIVVKTGEPVGRLPSRVSLPRRFFYPELCILDGLV